MKIAYVFHHDAANPAVQSGLPASSLAGFQRLGADIIPVFPLSTRSRKAYGKKIFSRLIGQRYRSDREPSYLEAAAAEFEARVSDEDYDFVYTPGSELVGNIRTQRPITFACDATFANMVDYYWDFSNLSPDYLRMGHEQEAAALARASLAVYTAEWAAKSAINDYGADPAKVAVIPFGANIGQENTWPEVRGWIEQRPRDEIRLLFVGRHWERKGGDILVHAAYCLAKLGHKVRVDIVGCPIPNRHRALPWLHGHGLLSPRVAADVAELHDLFTKASFVFVPSRAECYGMTFAEANAYGVPAISTDTGGICGVVKDGYNGYLLPLDAQGPAYADLIAAAWANPAHYERLCAQSFEAFARYYNWSAFCQKFVNLVIERGISPAPRRGAANSRLAEPARVVGRELFSAKEAWA
jgi:glycosyltransferase involved in cell wall biosynthesis